METLTISQLLSMPFYVYTSNTTHVEESDKIKDSYGNAMVCWVTGYAEIITMEELVLRFNWWGVGGKKPGYDVFSYEVYLNIDNPSFELINAMLVDEYGSVLELCKQHEVFRECLKAVDWQKSVIDILPIAVFEKVDVATENVGDPDSFYYLIRRDNDRSLYFEGNRLAHATSSKEQTANISSTGPWGSWTELNLYRSNGGRYVCERIDYTRDSKWHVRCRGAACDTLEQVI
jgi:hypothetical protein